MFSAYILIYCLETGETNLAYLTNSWRKIQFFFFLYM